MKYDDPLESDEEVDPCDPEDYIEEIDAKKTKPDLETEYRRTIRHTIRDESVLVIHSGETQPDRENNPTGEWTIAHATREIGDVTTHVVEVHDPKGKWVGRRRLTGQGHHTAQQVHHSHKGPTPKGAP